MRQGNSQQVTAVSRLREALLAGDFSPGQRLAEVPLATRFDVSRTPLRLALISLEHEGLVEEYPTGGYIVRSFRRSEIFDSIEIRGLIEGMAGRLVVERSGFNDADGSKLAEMRNILAAIDTSMDGQLAPEEAFQIYIDGNDRFHEKLMELASSAILSREMDHILKLPFAAPSSSLLRSQLHLQRARQIIRTGQDQHHSILEALENRESVRAEMLLREHSRLARTSLELALECPTLSLEVPALRLICDDEPHLSRVATKMRKAVLSNARSTTVPAYQPST
jgi:GntR family transcriptional regulator, vanillate catabolism transcriptional regulator